MELFVWGFELVGAILPRYVDSIFGDRNLYQTAEDRHKKGAVGLNQGRKQRYRRSCKLDGPNEKASCKLGPNENSTVRVSQLHNYPPPPIER